MYYNTALTIDNFFMMYHYYIMNKRYLILAVVVIAIAIAVLALKHKKVDCPQWVDCMLRVGTPEADYCKIPPGCEGITKTAN